MPNRLNAPSYHRNIDPIAAIITKALEGQSGHVLEVGSGSGQHITALAALMPDLTFWPSDPDDASRASTNAWTSQLKVANVKPSSAIDGSSLDWPLGEEGYPPTKLTAIQCFNVIHISPWHVVLGLLKSASIHLLPGGKLILYGPYKVEGKHIGQGNIDFDKSLKGRNAEWGIRDIEEVKKAAEKFGLILQSFEPMPANNFMPIFTKP